LDIKKCLGYPNIPSVCDDKTHNLDGNWVLKKWWEIKKEMQIDGSTMKFEVIVDFEGYSLLRSYNI